MGHMTERQIRRLYGPIAEPLGFTLEGVTSTGHWKWRHKSGLFCTVGGTKGVPRAVLNNRSQMRRIAREGERLLANRRAG